MREPVQTVRHFTAVDLSSFKVNKGSIFGFLGPNGSGKSTASACSAAFFRPPKATARIAGIDVTNQAEDLKRTVGYMSQKFSLYDELTNAREPKFYSRPYGLHGRHEKSHPGTGRAHSSGAVS